MEAYAYVMFYRKFINTFHVVVNSFYIYILYFFERLQLSISQKLLITS